MIRSKARFRLARARRAPGTDPAPEAPLPLSRRRLCRDGALAVVGLALVPGAGLLAGCSGGDDGDDASAGGDLSGDGAPGAAEPGAGPGVDLGGAGGRPVMYSSPTCGCCSVYATYLGENGHDVEVRHLDERGLSDVKSQAGIPAEAESCHTTMIDGYAIEGHVPVEAVDRLLREHPDLDGIALPGMPIGSPGMDGPQDEPFEILSVKDGATEPYMTI